MAETIFRTEIIVKLSKDHEHEKESVSEYINAVERGIARRLIEDIAEEFGFVPEIVLNGELYRDPSSESHVTMAKYIQP